MDPSTRSGRSRASRSTPRSRATRLPGSTMRRLTILVAALLAAAPASAQSVLSRVEGPVLSSVEGQPQATLRVVVVDQTGASIVGAAVRVTPLTGAPIAIASDNRGQAVVS